MGNLEFDSRRSIGVEMEKRAAIAKKIQAEPGKRLIIDNQTWEKTELKPQIVNLWHKYEKASHDSRGGHGSYSRTFNFENAESSSVSFTRDYEDKFGVMLEEIQKELDELGVKYAIVSDNY